MLKIKDLNKEEGVTINAVHYEQLEKGEFYEKFKNHLNKPPNSQISLNNPYYSKIQTKESSKNSLVKFCH